MLLLYRYKMKKVNLSLNYFEINVVVHSLYRVIPTCPIPDLLNAYVYKSHFMVVFAKKEENNKRRRSVRRHDKIWLLRVMENLFAWKKNLRQCVQEIWWWMTQWQQVVNIINWCYCVLLKTLTAPILYHGGQVLLKY